MKPIVLQKIDHALRSLTYERLSLCESDTGFEVLREWGCLGKAPQAEILAFDSRKAAENYLVTTCQEKQKNGYELLLGSDIPLSYTQAHCQLCLELKQGQGVCLETFLFQSSPGRCRLIYHEHLGDIFELPAARLLQFFSEVQRVREALPTTEFQMIFHSGNHFYGEIIWNSNEALTLPLSSLVTLAGQQMNWIDLLSTSS